MIIYFDSSAFIKFCGKEKGSKKIIEIVKKAKKRENLLVSSTLMIPEIIGGFDKWYRQRLITKLQFEQLLKFFLGTLIELIENGIIKFILLDNSQAINNMNILVKHHFGGCDLIHLNAAVLSDCDLFVASDKQLCNGAKDLGLKVLNPEEKTL